MSNLTPIYLARKCTTDQLNAELNDLAYDWFDGKDGEVMQVTHVGGRDWVIIFRATGSEDQRSSVFSQKVDARLKRSILGKA